MCWMLELPPTKNNKFGSLESSVFIKYLQRTLHALGGNQFMGVDDSLSRDIHPERAAGDLDDHSLSGRPPRRAMEQHADAATHGIWVACFGPSVLPVNQMFYFYNVVSAFGSRATQCKSGGIPMLHTRLDPFFYLTFPLA